MATLPIPVVDLLSKLNLIAVLDILLVAVLIYQFIAIIRGRRSAHILLGILLMVIIYLGSVRFGLELLRSILAALAPYTVFAFIVLFQNEISETVADGADVDSEIRFLVSALRGRN